MPKLALLLNFDTASLFSKRIDVIELSADRVLVSIPDSEDTDNENIDITRTEQNKESNWRAMLVPFRLQKLALRHIEVLSKNLNIPAFQLDGSTELLWQDALFRSDIILKTKAQPEAQISHSDLGKVAARSRD